MTAKEAMKSLYFKSDFIATVAYFLGTAFPTGNAIIKSITDVEVKRRMLLASSVNILYLVPVQNISMSIALSILTKAAQDGSFTVLLNRKLGLHSVPYKVSVALPLKTDRNPTEAPTMTPTILVVESRSSQGITANTIGLIAGVVSVGILMIIVGSFYLIQFCRRKFKRK